MKVFCLFLLLYVYATSSIAQVSSPPPAVDPADSTAIHIMSYNIKMLPRILRYIHHEPVQRAKIIPRFLIAENCDVMILEEAFDDRCCRILRRKLRKKYPYIYGPVNKDAGTTFSGGVMILSKYKMKKLGQIRFKSCSGNDCWAHKGAILVELAAKGHTIQVMGTHMQAGGIPQIHRDQYAQMAAMLQRYERAGVPQILGGDYNTFHSDTSLYPAMLSTLRAEDGPIYGANRFTSDDVICDMSENYCRQLSHYEQDVIDYILYKSNGKPYQAITRRITRYKTPWSFYHQDLSDHLTLIMDVKL